MLHLFAPLPVPLPAPRRPNCSHCGRPRQSNSLGLCGRCLQDDGAFFARLERLDPARAARVRLYQLRASARLPLFTGADR